MPRKKDYDGAKWPILRQLFKEAHPFKPKAEAEKLCKEFWEKYKSDPVEVDLQIRDLRHRVQSFATQNPILQAFKAIPKQRIATLDVIEDSVGSQAVNEISVANDETVGQPASQGPRSPTPEQEPLKPPREKPKQDAVAAKLRKEKDERRLLIELRDKGFGLSPMQQQRLKDLDKSIEGRKKKLKTLEGNRKAVARARESRKKELENSKRQREEVVVEEPRAKGRPRLETKYPGLHDAILEIVNHTASADERRRTATLRTPMSIDKLLQELRLQGFPISRSGLYLRLLPRNCNTREGRRHFNTVPVKMARAQNSMRAPHEDTHFAAATVRHIKDLCELFGEDNVLVISQDDKAKIAMGIAAAHKQGPILMRMDKEGWKVLLPDHDWVVANRHKLIPSVYAILCFKDGKLCYSGPTYIAIRSGKHDSSTAASHRQDVQRIFGLSKFDSFTKRDGEVKPILVQLVDGGGDQKPANGKTLTQAISNFLNYNLDAVFVATHAPHQSASNPVERRMAPLSKQLCGVILPYKHYGNHLNSSRQTVDHDLEVRNFGRAGTVLKELWNGMMIDGYEVFAEYIPPPGTIYIDGGDGDDDENSEAGIDTDQVPNTATGEEDIFVTESVTATEAAEERVVTEEWKAIHVRHTKYTIQIVKCKDRSCCSPPKTNILELLPERFLPPPLLYERSHTGVSVADPKAKQGKYFDLFTRLSLGFLKPHGSPTPIPYDLHCPTAVDSIRSYLCKHCGLYCVTKSQLLNHQRMHARNSSAIPAVPVKEEEEDEEIVVEPSVNHTIPVIEDVGKWWEPIIEIDDD